MTVHLKNFHQNIKNRDPKSVYYLLTFLIDFSMSLIFVTYTLFLISKGLDLLQINLVNVAYMTGSLIFEIPTGAYADYFGRKKSIIASAFLLIVSFTLYSLSSNFISFVVAELVWALATTFLSGALDAWIVDALHRDGSGGKVDFVFSQASVLGRVAALFGGLIGAYIGVKNLALPFGVGAVISFVTLFIAIIFLEEKVIKHHGNLKIAHAFSKMGKVVKDSVDYGFRHPVVFWLVISTMLFMFSIMPLNMYWAPRLNNLAGNQIILMGWIWALMSFFMAVGGYFVNVLLKRKKNYTFILIIMTLALSLPIIFISYSNILPMIVIGMVINQFGRGIRLPAHKAYINSHISSEKRATILSFDSGMGRLGAAIGLVVFGLIAKNYSIQLSWLIAGLTLLILIPVYIQAKNREAEIRI